MTRWLALLLAGSVLSTGVALGHSRLQRAEPSVESTLKRPPTEVKLYFSERLEPAYSTVRVHWPLEATGLRQTFERVTYQKWWGRLSRSDAQDRGGLIPPKHHGCLSDRASPGAMVGKTA
jgi:hypothetical protein